MLLFYVYAVELPCDEFTIQSNMAIVFYCGGRVNNVK